MSSGFMNPLDTMVGVHRISLSLSRTVMLPSFAAAKPLLYSRRPISQICSLILYSGICMVVIPQAPTRAQRALGGPSLHIHRIQNARTVRIQRLLVRLKRHRGLDAFADA